MFIIEIIKFVMVKECRSTRLQDPIIKLLGILVELHQRVILD